MARHQHAHQIFRLAKARFAGDDDFADLAAEAITDRALDEVSLLINQRRGGRAQGEVADVFPDAQQVIEIALDIFRRALGAGSTQDDRHALRQFQPADQILHPLAVARIGDFAADPAAARRVRHQHAVAAGQRQEGGDRRAFVAALLFRDLDQHDLAALDHLLNLVVLGGGATAVAQILDLVLPADGLDVDGLGLRPRLTGSPVLSPCGCFA